MDQNFIHMVETHSRRSIPITNVSNICFEHQKWGKKVKFLTVHSHVNLEVSQYVKNTSFMVIEHITVKSFRLHVNTSTSLRMQMHHNLLYPRELINLDIKKDKNFVMSFVQLKQFF